MKIIILLLGFIISNSAFSQTINPENYSQPDVADHLRSWGNKFMNATPRQAATVVGEAVVANKVKTTFGVAGGLTLLGAGYSYNEIVNHPDKIENMLEGYPEHIPAIEKYVSQYSWGQQYLNNIGVGDRFYSQQLTLESSNEWQNAYLQVINKIIAVAEKQYDNVECKNPNYVIAAWQALVSKPDIFDTTPAGMKANSFIINQSGNIMPKKGIAIFDVNSYKNLDDLSKEKDGLDLDHLPAKATVRLFLNDKRGPIKLNTDEVKNLYLNLTTMAVTQAMHYRGRTYGGKNNIPNIEIDSKSLAITTVKDMTNHYLYVTKNVLNQRQFINSAIVVWKRNKALCLF